MLLRALLLLNILRFCTSFAGTEPTVTQRVYIDVSIGGGAAERITIGLFGEECPKTVANFVGVIKGFEQNGKTLQLQGSKFHRIINGFMAQGGDITRGDGRGGASIYGGAFADEVRALRSKWKRDHAGSSSPLSSSSSSFSTTPGAFPSLAEFYDQAQPGRPAVDGQRRPEHQQEPILHDFQADAASEREARRLWAG